MRASLFTILTLVLFGTLVNAWKEDPRCKNLGPGRLPPSRGLESVASVDEDTGTTVDNEPCEKVDNKHSIIRLPVNRSLRGSDGNAHRQLGIYTFKMKMFHQHGYCWQKEWEDRKWCWSCYGATCIEDEKLWLQQCNDNSLIQRFTYTQDQSGGVRISPYMRQDLCLDQSRDIVIDGNLIFRFTLRPCVSDSPSQVVFGWNPFNEFELYSVKDGFTKCVTQAHHPKAGEEIFAEVCGNARHDKTNKWVVYQAHSDLDPTPPEVAPQCPPGKLLDVKEELASGETYTNWDFDAFIIQEANGNLKVMRGKPDQAEDLVWESGIDSTPGDYYTRLQGDGNMKTFRGISPNRDDGVWRTGSNGVSMDYFLGIDCDLQAVSIYEYHPDDYGEKVWTSRPGGLSAPLAQAAPPPTISAPPPTVSIPPPSLLPSSTPPPTSVPTSSLLETPTAFDRCPPRPLLLGKQEVAVGHVNSWDSNVFIVQEGNGNVKVMAGHPDTGMLVWESGVNLEPDNYYTRLQGDGNMITYRGESPDRSDGVWRTKSNSESMDYFFGVDCDLTTVAIYRGTPSEPGDTVWSWSPIAYSMAPPFSDQALLVPFEVGAMSFSELQQENFLNMGDCNQGIVDAQTTDEGVCVARNGQCAIGWTDPNDSLTYLIETPTDEIVTIKLRVSSEVNTEYRMSAYLEGIPGTMTWNTKGRGVDVYNDKIWRNVELPAGTRRLTVNFDEGNINMCSIKVELADEE